jgi:hypothetical protein
VVIEQLQPRWQVWAAHAVSNSARKQLYKPAQAVLVHGVNGCQVSDGEVQQAGVVRHWLVLCSASTDSATRITRDVNRDVSLNQIGSSQALVLQLHGSVKHICTLLPGIAD